jgi:hypothetical protein
MIIGDLGEEEILLLSCDDGNVTALHTKAIGNEIKHRKTSPLTGHEHSEIRAFFCQNVGLSAWGLAIHTRARMIAVSSNTTDITVFAFCLVDPQTDSDSDVFSMGKNFPESDLNDWRPYSAAGSFPGSVGPTERRNHNIVITLRGHHTNIPSISFFNSDRDTEGRWLLSTDIHGQIRVWDIWYCNGMCLEEHSSWVEERYRPFNHRDSL